MNKKYLVLSLLWILLLLGSTRPASAVTITIPHRGHHIIESIGDPETVDPAWAYDTASGEIISQVYEPLVTFNRERTGAFVDCLATDVVIQDINQYDSVTGITWKQRLTFKIRGTGSVHTFESRDDYGVAITTPLYNETDSQYGMTGSPPPTTISFTNAYTGTGTPKCTTWHEITATPGYLSRKWHLCSWTDTDASGTLNAGDQIDMRRKCGNTPVGPWWNTREFFHVDSVTTDTVGGQTRYTLTVSDKPVYFPSSDAMTTEDVEYSFERWMVQDRSGGPEWMIYEPVEGIGYYHAGAYPGTGFSGAGATLQANIIDRAFQHNTTHFWMNLAVRYSPILGIIAQFWAAVVSEDFMRAAPVNDWTHDWSVWPNYHDPATAPVDVAGNAMNGTGPYKKDYWTAGVEWSVIKNDEYWGEWPYEHGSAYLTRVTEKVVYEWSTRLADFQAGTADVVYVPRQYIAQVEGWPGIRGLKDLPSLSADGMFFNLDIDTASTYAGTKEFDKNNDGTPDGIPLNFFSDKRIRKAFAYLFNYTKFLKEVWLNEAVAPNSPIIGGIPYHLEPEAGGPPRYDINVAKATSLFNDASSDSLSPAYQVMTKGFYMKITYNTGNQPRQVSCDMLKANAKLVNTKFLIDTIGVTWSTYLGELWWYPTFKSVMPIYMIGWVADYPDAHNWVMPFMHKYGDFAAPSSYNNATVNSWIELAIAAPEGWGAGQRGDYYTKLQWAYYYDCPNVMLEQAYGRRWERDWVQGWYYNPIQSAIFYTRWEGLNGDIDGNGVVNSLDAGKVSYYWYKPPVVGLNKIYDIIGDVGPVLQYQETKLPPPGASIGEIDIVDLAVVSANWLYEIAP